MIGRWQMGWYNGWSPEQRCATLPIQREAIRSGAISTPTTCSICDTTPKPGSGDSVWLHDEDYADPLAAYHVCRRCHQTLHRRFEEPGPWLALVATYATGSRSRWFEQLSMDPASLRQPFGVTYPNGLPSAEPRASLDAVRTVDP
jgi:hypothetical protein